MCTLGEFFKAELHLCKVVYQEENVLYLCSSSLVITSGLTAGGCAAVQKVLSNVR